MSYPQVGLDRVSGFAILKTALNKSQFISRRYSRGITRGYGIGGFFVKVMSINPTKQKSPSFPPLLLHETIMAGNKGIFY